MKEYCFNGSNDTCDGKEQIEHDKGFKTNRLVCECDARRLNEADELECEQMTNLSATICVESNCCYSHFEITGKTDSQCMNTYDYSDQDACLIA